MTCGNTLLQKVYETGFALDEITLYLDTHPTDKQAMEYYQYIRKANRMPYPHMNSPTDRS